MADGAQETLEGTLERIVFQNQETQWTVARIATDDGAEVTAVGSLLGVTTGTGLRLRGQWVEDRRFGRQFKVDSYQTRSPETRLGIERYLGSGAVPGIGPELAKRIVERFGLDTLEIIAQRPGELTAVDGIGPARAEAIAAAWQEQHELQEVMVFLRGHGVSAAFAGRIYKRYGKDAVGVVRQNPYRLAIEVWGIGFRTADAIARSLGMATDAPERLEAGLLHVLGELEDEGHCHAPEGHAIQTAAELLGVAAELLAPAVSRLLLSGLVVREQLGRRGPCLSRTAMRETERAAAEALATLARTPPRPLSVELETFLAEYEREQGIELAAEQRRAIAAAVRDKVVVITGGPGVGKTTIVRAVVTLFSGKLRRIALAAPTGRAAKRLTESTGAQAVTLHRLLEFQPQSSEFARTADTPLEADVVVVDEASMIDIALFEALVAAIPPAAQLVLVGDIDQLPSVGPGAVLADVIESGAATVAPLTEIFRQAAESRIVVSAHRVNRGELPELEPPAGSDPARSDFYFIEREDPVAARDTLVELVAERIPQRFGFDPLIDLQVLTPMHRGELGTAALNAALQERLTDADAPRLSRGQRHFRAGDKVMQLKNDYDKDVYNGDLGVVRRIDGADEALLVELADGRFVRYERGELDELVHAFAISIHKSQGSEYPAVVIPLVTQHYLMLQRNLLYTAITRGKRLVVLLGSRRAVSMAVQNQRARERWTYLAERTRAALAA